MSSTPLLTATGVCFLVVLVVPTAAVTFGEDEVVHGEDGVVLKPTDTRYATVDDELRLDLESLNDRAITRVDNVFTIVVTGSDVDRVWIDHDVAGIAFYRGDDPSATISESNPLELSAGDTATVGVAVDTHVAQDRPETFSVVARYEDGSNDRSAPSSAIQRSELNVSPTTVETGETVTATATYRNYGKAPGETTASLTVDGIVVDQRTVAVEPGETESVTFERPMEWPGTYAVGIDGDASEPVTVDGPPIDVVDATVDDATITAGESTTVRATVRNPSDEGVERTLELAVDGIVVDSRAVSVPANGERMVTFERTFDEPGTSDVAVSGVPAGTVSVDEPGAFSIRDRELAASTAAALAPPATAGLVALLVAANRRRVVVR